MWRFQPQERIQFNFFSWNRKIASRSVKNTVVSFLSNSPNRSKPNYSEEWVSDSRQSHHISKLKKTRLFHIMFLFSFISYHVFILSWSSYEPLCYHVFFFHLFVNDFHVNFTCLFFLFLILTVSYILNLFIFEFSSINSITLFSYNL